MQFVETLIPYAIFMFKGCVLPNIFFIKRKFDFMGSRYRLIYATYSNSFLFFSYIMKYMDEKGRIQDLKVDFECIWLFDPNTCNPPIIYIGD
jgi:hypothetical protein